MLAGAQAAQVLIQLPLTSEMAGAFRPQQVRQRLPQEAVELVVALVEAPPDDAGPAGRVHVVMQPVPGQRALAEAAQRAQDQQRMGRPFDRLRTRQPFGQPVAQHLPFRGAAGEVGLRAVGMRQEPAGPLGFGRRFRDGRRAQRGQELRPRPVRVVGVSEVDVGEIADFEGKVTLDLEQRDQPQFAGGRVKGLQHKALELGPGAGQVSWRQRQHCLATALHRPRHLFNARRAGPEVPLVDADLQPSVFQPRQQLAAHPGPVVVAVRDEDVVAVFLRLSHRLPPHESPTGETGVTYSSLHEYSIRRTGRQGDGNRGRDTGTRQKSAARSRALRCAHWVCYNEVC